MATYTQELTGFPALWTSFADVWSGRTDPFVSPAHESWEWDGPVATIVAGDLHVTLTLRATGDVYLFTCPAPADTMVSVHAIINDVRSRRSLVWGCGRDVGFTAYGQTVYDFRWTVMQLLFPTHAISYIRLVGPENAWAVGTVQVVHHVTLILFQVGTATASLSGTSEHRGTVTFSELDSALDVSGFFFFEQNAPGGFWDYLAPADPDSCEAFAGWLQFPGMGDAINAEELATIDKLAVELNALASRSVAIGSGSGMRTFKMGGQSVVLPPKVWTTARILKRLAAAVRALFRGDLELGDGRGNVASLTKGILRRQEHR